LPSDAPERAFCRSSSRPSSSQAWRSSSAVKPMISLCDEIAAGRDQPGNKRRTKAINLSISRQENCRIGYTVTHARAAERHHPLVPRTVPLTPVGPPHQISPVRPSTEEPKRSRSQRLWISRWRFVLRAPLTEVRECRRQRRMRAAAPPNSALYGSGRRLRRRCRRSHLGGL
jgi:hypothetical protein